MYFMQRNNDVCLYKSYHWQKLIFLSVQLVWLHCSQNCGALSGWETTHPLPLPAGVGGMSPLPPEGLDRLDTLQAGTTYNLPWEKHSSKHAGCLDTLDLLCLPTSQRKEKPYPLAKELLSDGHLDFLT